jgi:hypothetical protein
MKARHFWIVLYYSPLLEEWNPGETPMMYYSHSALTIFKTREEARFFAKHSFSSFEYRIEKIDSL